MQRALSSPRLSSPQYRWRTAPEVAALAAERSPWRRALRALWCLVLAVAGQLALAVAERCRLLPSVVRTLFLYVNPFTRGVRDVLRPVRAPPLPLL